VTAAPSVAARIRRLEQAGVIEGCHARINSTAVGLPVAAFLQVHAQDCLASTSWHSSILELSHG
jgi:DNA-binding Lrp family transcriptional regulator